jgi:uncharacterized protein YdaU (DUF1376 family)
MRGLPYVPFFTSDWLASSARIDMTLGERAIYLDLLFQIWERGGAIPADEARLAKLSMAASEEFAGAWPGVRKHFVAHPDQPGMLTNLKMLDVIRKQATNHEAQSRNGRRGGIASGRSRKRKGSENEAESKHPETEPELEPELERELETDARIGVPEQANEEKTGRAPSSSLLNGKDAAPHSVKAVEEFLSAYPKKTGHVAARKAYSGKITDRSLHILLMDGLARWMESDQWVRSLREDGGRYVPYAATFISDRLWAEYPPSAKAAPVDPIAEAVRRIKEKEQKL